MVKAVFRSTRPKKGLQSLTGFEPGELIVREGEPGESMYVIQQGEIEILKQVDGVETVLATLSKGDFFGEMAVLEQLPRAASARAKTACKVLEIDARQFDQMLRTRPEISVRIMRKFSLRLRETVRHLREAQRRAAALADVAQARLAETEATAEAPEPESAVETDGIAFETIAEAAIKDPRLVHEESGTVYVLPHGNQLAIGRHDRVTGVSPDIDLTSLDGDGTSGHLHARLMIQDGRFLLQEEIGCGSRTFVNGERLQTGVGREIVPGDTLRLGEVELTLRAG